MKCKMKYEMKYVIENKREYTLGDKIKPWRREAYFWICVSWKDYVKDLF